MVVSTSNSSGLPASSDIADGCGVTLSFATTKNIPYPDTLSLETPNNRPIVVVDDGTNMTKELMSKLGDRGVCLTFDARRSPGRRCVRLNGNDEKALTEALTSVEKQYGVIGGVVCQESDRTITGFPILIAKHVKESLHKEIAGGRCFFLGVARMDGQLGLTGNTVTPSADLADSILGTAERGAIFGLVKTLGLEWPHVFCRAVDVAVGCSDGAFRLMSEINDSDRCLREVGYDETGSRWTTCAPILREEPTSSSGGAPSEYSPDDVFLVAGGGRGITPVCMAAVARRVGGGTFFLLGRSKVSDEPAWARDLEGESLKKGALAELKRIFIASGKNKKNKPTPKVHKKLISSIEGTREVHQSIANIQEAGGRAHYMSCDACDENAVRQCVSNIRQQHGLEITGIVQAAGVLRDKMVHNKTYDDFSLVYNTKIVGLRNLLRHVDRNKLRQIVVFSSLAGFHGNRGQSDYAMANEVLNKAAHVLTKTLPKCRTRALDFGPWDGGMVTDQLKAMFKSQGVEIIPYEEGAQIVAAMLTEQTSVQGLVGNWGLPPSRAKRSKNVLTRVIERNGGAPFLESHQIKGKRVLPLAVATTSMAERALSLYQGYRVSSIQDTVLFTGMTMDQTTTTELSVEEIPQSRGGKDGDDVHVKCKLSIVDARGRSRPGYQCLVVLTSKRAEGISPRLTGVSTTGSIAKYNQRTLYNGTTLFHGPVFQEVEEVVRSSPAGIMVKCRKRSSVGSFRELGQYAGKEDSIALDVVMQTFLIWARHERGCAALPTGCKHIEYFGTLKENQEYFTSLSADKMSMQDATWNAKFNVHDKAGHIFIRGVATVTLHEGLTY